jgi:CRISPR-associated endonuclease/helicase Cas3
MSTLLERLIQWLSALGSSVILLSATLPAHQKKKLLKAYIGDDKYTDLKPIYPAITYSDSLSKPQVTEFESNHNVRQTVTIVPVENDIAIVSKIFFTRRSYNFEIK